MSDDKLDPGEIDTYVQPGEKGHNAGKEVVWTQWQRKRTFVRALEGTYGEVYKSLYAQPRVIPASQWRWKGGPHVYSKIVISPGTVEIAQSIESHVDTFAPGGHGQKHGHMNSAVFFVLKGDGHDVHDGHRHDWSAGDACIVENGCVHQHFNDLAEDFAVVLVMKAKPLFLFMHMLFQKMVEYPPKEPLPAQIGWTPPTNI